MSTQTRIRDLVLRELRWSGSPEELTNDVSLIDNKMIDSLDLLKLISALEEEFEVNIPDEDLVPENFESIDKIAEYVDAIRDR